MGCCSSRGPRPSDQPTSSYYDEGDDKADNFTHMTGRQKTLVYCSMKALCSSATIKSNSADFLMHLFRNHPDYQDFFKLLKDKTGAQVRLSSQIRSIGQRIFLLMFKLTEKLDSPELSRTIIEALATDHYKRGITDKHFIAMQDAFIDYMANKLGPEFDDEIKTAWMTFWDMIVRLVEEKQSFLAKLEEDSKHDPRKSDSVRMKKTLTERFLRQVY